MTIDVVPALLGNKPKGHMIARRKTRQDEIHTPPNPI